MQVGRLYASSFGVEYISVSYGEVRAKSWIDVKNLKGFVLASEEVSSAVKNLVADEAVKRVEEAFRGLQERSKEKG